MQMEKILHGLIYRQNEQNPIVFEEIDTNSATQKCGETLLTDENESYFYEPAAFQLDPSILRSTLYDAIDENGVVLMEKTEVDTILTKGKEIIGITTNNGKLDAKILLMQLELGVHNYFQR